MVRTREEILSLLSELTDGRTDDRTLEIIEDITDTVSDYATRIGDNTDWKEKYDQLDSEWREKYRARFFSPGAGADEKVDTVETDEEKEEVVKTRFEDLFS